jgi:hypothetical protein
MTKKKEYDCLSCEFLEKCKDAEADDDGKVVCPKKLKDALKESLNV